MQSLTNQKDSRLRRPPLILVILDGWGVAPEGPYNAIHLAETPTIDMLWEKCPHTKLYAHGTHVGLPFEQVGNSEAGHMNIGAGRIVVQDAVHISRAINDGSFQTNEAFLKAIDHIKRHGSKLHFIGILSGEQCPHMSPDHIIALNILAVRHNIKVLWHFFTDGRDSPPHAAISLWKELQRVLTPSSGEVATIAGRLFLDRKKDWSRTRTIYNTLVLGEAKHTAKDFFSAVEAGYARGESDEFIQPTVIRNKKVTAKDNISDSDAIIFFNLRSDRARQLTKPFVQDNFEEMNQDSFTRTKVLRNLVFVAMTDFGPDLKNVYTAFRSEDVKNTLPKVLAHYYKQLYISEMEKYAHVTYFFNGGYKDPVADEERILVKSKEVDAYDSVPEMSSAEITGVVAQTLHERWYNFVCVNYPNADMIGHTGNMKAAIKACETIDVQVKILLDTVKRYNGSLVITADHGNAEYMGSPPKGGAGETIDTMHEKNPVPLLIYTHQEIELKNQDSEDDLGGKLGDVAPTLLELAGIEKPHEMTGESLIVRVPN